MSRSCFLRRISHAGVPVIVSMASLALTISAGDAAGQPMNQPRRMELSQAAPSRTVVNTPPLTFTGRAGEPAEPTSSIPTSVLTPPLTFTGRAGEPTETTGQIPTTVATPTLLFTGTEP